ncbi:MAG: histidinol-phosphate transaminase [Vicinamibacteria bacterium]
MRRKKDPVSWIRPAVKALNAYHLEPHDVAVKLDQNENGLGVPAPVRDALLDSLRRAPLHLYPSPTRAEILGTLSEMSQWPREGILVGNGSDELLHALAESFLEPGRKSVSPTPSFFVYSYTTRLVGATSIEVPLDERMRYDVDAILAAIEEHQPAVVYLCSPNNPTGSTLGPEEMERVLEGAPGVVALDEAYWEFASWNARALLDSHRNLLIIRTFSKAMALAGLRLGFVMAAPEIAIEMRKAQQPYPLNRLSIEAARAAWAHIGLLRERALVIARERDRLYERLREMRGVAVYPSKGNFLLFRTALGAAKTFQSLLGAGVLVRDVSSHPRLPEMLRVAVGAPEENEAFYEALKRALEDSP